MRANPSDYKSTMQAVVVAFDEIVEQAKRLAPIDGESFDSWLVRLSGELGLPDDTFGHLLELTRAVAGVVELELEEGTEASEAGNPEEEAQLDYIIALRESMGSLSDVMPSAVPGRVTFTTMHGAKGLTAETVFVLQAEDEIIPGDASGHGFDESRRLLYVSLTRAKKHLVICACTHRTGPQRFSGQSESAQRHLTRFLDGYGLHAQTIAQYLAGKINGPS